MGTSQRMRVQLTSFDHPKCGVEDSICRQPSFLAVEVITPVLAPPTRESKSVSQSTADRSSCNPPPLLGHVPILPPCAVASNVRLGDLVRVVWKRCNRQL